MQGLDHFVPTELKIQYLNALLAVGFDTLDFGSFVSPKAIPQMRDTAEVLAGLDVSKTKTKLLAIVANLRGAEDALTPRFDSVHRLPLIRFRNISAAKHEQNHCAGANRGC